MDAEAAILHATILGQPEHTTIYFGIDYDFNGENEDEKRGLIEYFQKINEIFDHDKRYFVGAYANGAALKLLLEWNKDKPLVRNTWISPSRGYHGTTDFYNHMPWNPAET